MGLLPTVHMETEAVPSFQILSSKRKEKKVVPFLKG